MAVIRRLPRVTWLPRHFPSQRRLRVHDAHRRSGWPIARLDAGAESGDEPTLRTLGRFHRGQKGEKILWCHYQAIFRTGDNIAFPQSPPRS